MNANILIVDDATFMRTMIKAILSKYGYENTAEADSGVSAVEKYIRHRPALTLMDITMPEMDGISAVKVIRKIDPEANIVMCSAISQEDMVIEAIESGARDFIVKPFPPERLVEAVSRALGR
ncbi:MAG TPA: response regulator [Verrucomicrobiae bacterium]|nr:response regulator [Verrucomicrobiae bacterium]